MSDVTAIHVYDEVISGLGNEAKDARVSKRLIILSSGSWNARSPEEGLLGRSSFNNGQSINHRVCSF